MKDVLIVAVRLFFGTTYKRIGSGIILVGLALLPSALQAIAEAVLRRLDVDIQIPDAPLWLALGLIFVGILVALLDLIPSGPPSLPAAPNPHDVDLLKRYRAIVTVSVREFLRDHDFWAPFAHGPVYKISDLSGWRGADCEFVDEVVEAEFAKVKKAADEFDWAVSYKTAPHDRNPHLQTALPAGHDHWRPDPQTVADVKLLNESARLLIDAIDEFERVAKKRIPAT